MTYTSAGDEKRASMRRYFRGDLPAFLILAAVVTATAVPFVPRHPVSWDAGNFVLAVKHFSLAGHQPHPPGYPLFVALAKLFSGVLSPHRALLVENGAAAFLAACLMFITVRHRWTGRFPALLISIAFVTSPLFWFYRSMALTYSFDALGAVLIFLLSSRDLSGAPGYSKWSALSLGLAAAFRPSMLVLLWPLQVFPSLRSRAWRRLLSSQLILLGTFLCWFLPLTLASGGLSPYLRESQQMYLLAARATSSFYGAPLVVVLRQLVFTLRTLLSTVSLLVLPLAWGIIADLLPERDPENASAGWSGLLLAGALPALLVYGLIHLGDAGYLLLLLPLAFLGAAPGLMRLPIRFHWIPRKTASAFLLCLISVNMALFLLASPLSLRVSEEKTPARKVTSALVSHLPALVSFNARVLAESDREMAALVQILQSFPPKHTLVLTVVNYPPPIPVGSSGLPPERLLRSLAAVLPEYTLLELNPQSPYRLENHDDRTRYVVTSPYPLPDAVRTVVLLADHLDRPNSSTGIRLQRHVQAGFPFFSGTVHGDFRIAGASFVRVTGSTAGPGPGFRYPGFER